MSTKYALDILQDSGLTAARPSSFPMEQKLRLTSTDGIPLPDPTTYRRLLGRLIYLTVTRPDITFAVNNLSQFMQNPTFLHLDVAHRILCYIKGTLDYGIFLSSSSLHISGYCDSDWAGGPSSR